MRSAHKTSPGFWTALVVVGALLGPVTADAQSWSASSSQAASPTGVFGSIFGSFGNPFERRDARPQPIPTLAYAPPETPGAPGALPPGVGTPGVGEIPNAAAPTAYCVRLCDGRFFPLSAAANVTPAKLCSAFCPASRTKVFEGAGIDQATAPDGSRYASLSTAHLYRKELVDGCTCNGKDAFGLAKVDLAADPTLRAGDVVATSDGLRVFNGAPGSRHKAASFTPIRKSALVSGDIRQKLRGLRVAKEFKVPERRL